MCYQAQQGQAVVPGSAVPEDTVPAQPAVLMAPLPDLQLMAPLLCGSTQSSRKRGFLPPSYRDRNFTLWRYEGLLNKRSEASRALCLAPWKIFQCGTGYIQPLPFQICKTGKSNLIKSAVKLNSFTIIKMTEIYREQPHRIFLPPHIQEVIFSLLYQFEPLSVIHCSTKTEQNTNMGVWLQK